MPYTNEQKARQISELQRYLYSISHFNERIPRILPDGIFGPETTETLKVFQQEYDLPVTGEADRNTWDKAVEIFLEYNKEAVFLDVFPAGYILRPGSTGTIVFIIQVIINTLSQRFEGLEPVEINGIYNAKMQKSLDAFKEISGTGKDIDGVDTDTWNKLASGFNMMEKRTEN